MEISIILGGDAYHSRTKGAIKKLLQGLNFTTLGDGGTFTGFIVEDSTLDEIKKILGKYANMDGIHISLDEED
jgi:metal-dependent amidase/aminoacylase/carboxypeptidase family protein